MTECRIKFASLLFFCGCFELAAGEICFATDRLKEIKIAFPANEPVVENLNNLVSDNKYLAASSKERGYAFPDNQGFNAAASA